MKKFKTLFILPFIIMTLIMSCETKDDEQQEEEVVSQTCDMSASELDSLLNECFWVITDYSDGEEGFAFTDFNFDFADQTIHVFDKEETVVGEGNYEFTEEEEGPAILNIRSLFLEEFTGIPSLEGMWSVTSCSVESIEFTNGNKMMVMAISCN